jgi:hypothetical protein
MPMRKSLNNGPVGVFVAIAAMALVVLLGCDSETTPAESSSVAQPAIRAVEGLFNREIPDTLGLPQIQGEHALLYQATEEGYKFCHHPNLVVYKNRLHAMWSNGIAGEDENGQRILSSYSGDGVTWSEPAVLIEDPDGPDGRLACVAAGYQVDGDTLVAYYTAIVVKAPIHADNLLYARTSPDGETWTEPQQIADGFFIERPRALPGGRLLMPGQFADSQPRLMYTDSPDGITGWQDGKVPPTGAFQFPEPNWFRRPDGSLVTLFRTKNENDRLYAAASSDDGKSWSLPLETNFLDSTARFSSGSLPDGSVYIISNPGAHLVRIPLTIALSQDGVTFDRAFVIRGEATSQRWEGLHKLAGWQYPTSLVWGDYLYVVYSINKEDVGVTRIALSELMLKSPERK